MCLFHNSGDGETGEEYVTAEIAIPIDEANLITSIEHPSVVTSVAGGASAVHTSSASGGTVVRRTRKTAGTRKVALTTVPVSGMPPGKARKWEQKQVQIKTLDGEFQVGPLSVKPNCGQSLEIPYRNI